MAQRRGFPLVRTRTARRSTAWGLGPGSTVLTNFGSTTAQILGSGMVVNPGFGKLTVVRVHGLMSAYIIAATALQDGFAAALGIGIASGDAFGVGVTALPNPIADVAWGGWLFHSFFDCRAMTGIEADGANALSSVVQLRVDSKAMRKLSENEVMFASVETVESGTASMNVMFDSRVLAKLP